MITIYVHQLFINVLCRLMNWINKSIWTCFSDIPDLQVWTSSLVRTKQTAAYTKAPKQHFHEIDEINAGKFDGYTYDEVLKSHPEEFEARAKDKLGYRYPEGKFEFFTFLRILKIRSVHI